VDKFSRDGLVQKYWLTILLWVLAVSAFLSAYAAFVSALVFTFLVPGLIFFRFFHLKRHEMWAFIPVFSVLVSVNLIYFVSLAAGYSNQTILGCFVGLAAFYTAVVYWKGEPLALKQAPKIKLLNKSTIAVLLIVFLVGFAVLFSSVWVQTQQGIVITGSNWQDTPLHYGIIESINQGNFPPQYPDYAGQKMTYHYFVDFHTAIIENMVGYLPKLLPVLNAVFILVFALSIYALARDLGRRTAIIATVLAVFGWGFSYFGLFQALLSGQFSVSQNYIYQYGGTFGLPSIFDNLLQQRPMLMGLPVFALVLALLKNMEDKNRLLLAGILTGLVFEFHNVAFFCCYVAFAMGIVLSYKRFNVSCLYFLVPSVFALPFIFSGGPPVSVGLGGAFMAMFSQNPFIFVFLNLGIPLIIAVVSFVKFNNNLLKGTFVVLLLIPYIVLLTPNPWDMYKFFIFAWVPIAVLAAWMINKTPKIVIFTLVLLCIITSASVIMFNLQTNYVVATQSEVDLGMWVRDNTPQNAVFLTLPNPGLYSPPAFIGGRLTVSSYINWPYGHGVPLDQIYERQKDIESAYNGTSDDLRNVVNKYNVSYVYVGTDESNSKYYPNCVTHFNSISWLQTVYLNSTTYGDALIIYKVDVAQMNSSP
jgi:hypothetical protein